ncbi:thioredoxin-dependent thiol peroxidase [Flavobacteriales bacterium]|jgi:peroxiredoxin Q/BCP|nr:thioredoxin-dependent thiol peroxidase [Flavobacteriales bacterium]
MHHLNEGDPAPVFEAKDQQGRQQTLTDYSGQKLALYFYPKDNTPGCTNQACSLRDGMADLEKAGIKVLGVSINHAASHQKFIDKFDLPFDLLVDEDHALQEQYGVWGLKKFMGREYDGTHRTTFCIKEDGTIAAIIRKPKVKEHAQEVLAAFADER